MIYVTGGVRHKYPQLKKLINDLRLSGQDSLFIVGGILGGRGDMRAMRELSCEANVYPVLGRHEYYAKRIFPLLGDERDVDALPDILDEESTALLMEWIKCGGSTVLTSFMELVGEQRESVVEYLEDFNPYEEIEAGGHRFLLVSSGMRDFDADRSPDDYEEKDFITSEFDFNRTYSREVFFVSGSKPVSKLPGGRPDRVYNKNHHIVLSTGADSGVLLTLRLDDLKVIKTTADD